jgi:hypothetical protein
MSDRHDDSDLPRKRFFAGAGQVALAATALGVLGVVCAFVWTDNLTPAFEGGVSVGLIVSLVLCWLAMRARLDGPHDKRSAFIGTVAVVVALLDVLPWAWTRFWLMVSHGIGMPH